MAYYKKSTQRRSYSKPRSSTRRRPTKRRSVSRRSSSPQTIRIVVEQAPANALARPGIAAAPAVEKPKGRKF